jgi:hypothetical protein
MLIGKNYSQKLIPSLMQGPEKLEALMSNPLDLEFFYSFIVYQYEDIGRDYVTLPYQFLDKLLGAVSEEHQISNNVKKASIALALGILPEDFTNHTSSSKGKSFKKVFPQTENYTEGGQLKIKIPARVIDKYKERLTKLHKGYYA